MLQTLEKYQQITLTISGSSKGRTSHFDCDNAGSNPAPKPLTRRKIMAYLEELLHDFRKVEVHRDEVTFYEDRKDEI